MATSRPRALIVDDDPVVVHVLGALLAERGIDSVWAADGRDGLRRLSDELLSLDVLVTDLLMPGLSGDALVMAVRELGGERDLPIVVLSGHLDSVRADALRTAGADAVVSKDDGLEPAAIAALELLTARGRLGTRSGGQPVARIALGRQRG
ncbi:MAG: response regulator [Anaeromyxobacter sp.]